MRLIRRLSFVVLAFFLAAISFGVLMTRPVLAVDNTGELPPVTFVTADGNRVYFDNTFNIQVRFLDRSHLQVSVTGSNAGFSFNNGATLRTFVEGTFFDSDLDNTYRYVIQREVSDNSMAWTHIDEFSSLHEATNNDGEFGGVDHLRPLSASDLASYLGGTEITIVIDTDELGASDGGEFEDGGLCDEDDPVRLERSGDGLRFDCVEGATSQAPDFGDTTDGSGASFALTNWAADSFANFNIVYRYNGESGNAARLEAVDGDTGNDFVYCNDAFVRGDCGGDERINITLAQLANGALVPVTVVDGDGDELPEVIVAGSQAENPVDPAPGDEAALEANCPIDGGALRWILCPVFELAESASQVLFNWIKDLLSFDVNTSEGSEGQISPSGAEEIEGLWKQFRNIANILFIIAFLALILSQTLGGKL